MVCYLPVMSVILTYMWYSWDYSCAYIGRIQFTIAVTITITTIQFTILLEPKRQLSSGSAIYRSCENCTWDVHLLSRKLLLEIWFSLSNSRDKRAWEEFTCSPSGDTLESWRTEELRVVLLPRHSVELMLELPSHLSKIARYLECVLVNPFQVNSCLTCKFPSIHSVNLKLELTRIANVLAIGKQSRVRLCKNHFQVKCCLHATDNEVQLT